MNANTNHAVDSTTKEIPDNTVQSAVDSCAAASTTTKCFFCGYPRSRCPTKDAICNHCSKKGALLESLLSEKHYGDVKNWEMVLPEALHSIRSLLSTATNTTPYERLFGFSRRSLTEPSLPSWLLRPNGKRGSVRQSKHDPLVDEV